MGVLVLLFLCSGVSHHLALHKSSPDFHACREGRFITSHLLPKGLILIQGICEGPGVAKINLKASINPRVWFISVFSTRLMFHLQQPWKQWVSGWLLKRQGRMFAVLIAEPKSQGLQH